MALVPDIAANPRHDLLATAVDGRPVRHTIYSGRLHFGPPASALHDDGPHGLQRLALPARRPAVRRGALGQRRVVRRRLGGVGRRVPLHPERGALFAPDPRDPTLTRIQLVLTTQGYSGSVIGYRVTATVATRDVVRPPT